MQKLILCLITAIPALACSCDRDPGTPACSLFHNTQVVFRGRVMERLASPAPFPVYRVRVEEAFKGLRSDAAEVLLDTSAACSMTFEPGNDYLIYTSASGESRLDSLAMPLLWVSACSLSRRITNDEPDLAWLRRAARGELPSTGWIEGVVLQNGGRPGLGGHHVAPPGTTVTAANGGGTQSVMAGPDGAFRLNNLRPGHHTVSFTSAGLPPAKLLSDREQSTDLPQGGCAYVRASFDINASLSGRVLTSHGLPAAGIRVELGEILRGANRSGTEVKTIAETWANTAKDGTFLIKNVPIGNVVLAANLNGAPNGDERFDTVYAPGVQTLANAKTFLVKPNEKVTGVTLRLPPPLPFGNLLVDVLWADGSPAREGARSVATWLGRRAAFEAAPATGHRVALPLALNRNYDISADWLAPVQPFTYFRSTKPVRVNFTADRQEISVRLSAMPPRRN